MKRVYLRLLLLIAWMCCQGNAWGHTLNLTTDLSVDGYEANTLYNFLTNSPEVLPTEGDLRYRSDAGYGLHNFGSGSRSATVSISVTVGQLLVLQDYSPDYPTTVNVGTLNETLSTNTGYRCFNIKSTAETITLTCPRYGGVVGALLMDAQTVSYTINYLLNNSTVKTESGTGLVGTTVSAELPYTDDNGVNYYANSSSATSIILGTGTNILNVELHEPESWSYSIKAYAGSTELATLSTGTVTEGESVSYGYPQYIAKDGVLYKSTKQNSNPWWGKSFTPSADNATESVSYSAEGTTGIVFCEEAENIGTMAPVTGGNINIRASNKAGAYSSSAGSVVTTLTPGYYKLSTALYGNSGTAFTYKAGDSTILTLSTTGNPVHTTSDEFAVYANTDITVTGGNAGSSPKVVDYIFIQKTADAVEATYTINYTYDGNIITSETGTSYVGATASGTLSSYTDSESGQKYYVDENATTSFTIGSEQYVAEIALRLAASDAVATVNAVDGDGNILATFTSTGVEGESGTVFYRRIVENDGKYYDNGEYTAAAVNYGTTAVYGGEPVNVVYTLDESITYYNEVENLQGSRSNALIHRDAGVERSSGNAWYSLYNGAYIYLDDLEGGTYSITVSGRYFASSGDSHYANIIARATVVDDEGNESQEDTQLGTMTWSKGSNIVVNTIDNVTIPDDAMLIIQNPYSYNMNVSLDYIILRKNGTATLYAVDAKGNMIDAITTVSGQRGTTVQEYFPLMINHNGVYYKTEETPYVKEVEIDGDNSSANVVYQSDPQVVYYTDAESSSGSNSQYSWGGTGYVSGQNYVSRGKSLGLFTPGVYSVYVNVTGHADRNIVVRGIPKNANPSTNTIGTGDGYTEYGTITTTGLQHVDNIVITEASQIIINGKNSANKTNQSADYDYVYVVQTVDFGGVSEPLPEISSVDGTSRTLKIGGGISDQQYDVTTWYSLDNGTTWYNTDNPATTSTSGITAISGDNTDVAFADQPGAEYLTFDATATETQTVLTKSSINVTYEGQELTIESDIVSIDVTYGEQWTLTGGFDVTQMVKDEDSSHTGGNGYGNGYGYYTPKIRVYVNTGVLPQADKDALDVTLTCTPYEYGSCSAQTTNTVTLTKGIETDGKTYYTLPNDGELTESGAYSLSINGNGYNPGTVNNSFYKGKYKITFQTVDFSDPNAIDNIANDADGGYNGTWEAYETCQDLSSFSSWNSTGYTDYWWNYYSKASGTTIMKDITSCVSAGSKQTYNFRLVQTSTSNPIILRVGYGLVKNLNKAWLYRVAQSHISAGNEIGLMIYNTGATNAAADDVYDYQVPHITGSNIPEIDYLVPTGAAVKQYMVFTPVDVKTVTDCGLSTYCSYYSTYFPGDKYLDNDENYGAYYANKRTAYGTDYYLSRVWSVQRRTPMLIAHNNYYKQNVWEVEQTGMGATIEFRIINTGSTLSGSKELVGYLSDGDIRNDQACSEEGKSDGGYYLLPATGVYQYGYFNQSGSFKPNAPNLILHSGTTYGVDCVNFYTMASSSDHARIYSRSAWLGMYTSNYSTFNDENDGEGVKIFFDDWAEGNDDDAAPTAIELVDRTEDAGLSDNAYYTLTGMRVAKPSTPGIYIHNGKKIYVK